MTSDGLSDCFPHQDPSSATEGSDDEAPAVDDEDELAARIKVAVEYSYAKAVERAAKESSGRVGGKSPTLKESRRRAAEEVNTNAQGYHDVTPSEQLLGTYTASAMPPPPRGGYRAAMVEWRPGRLTEAKLKPEAIAFLPAHKVARLTREFQISILSTGGADENAKEAAKSRLEAALLRQLRKVRSFRGLALHASAHHSAASSLFTGTQLP